MLCTRCKANPATVHIEGHLMGKTVKLTLCADCAKAHGVNASWLASQFNPSFGASLPLSSMPPMVSDLLGLLSKLSRQPARGPGSQCLHYRWTLDRFRQTGRMGCPECYDHFRNEVRDIAARIHGSAKHIGKRLPDAPLPKRPAARSVSIRERRSRKREKGPSLADLRTRLEKAVREERFEMAARLRDQIREMEAGGGRA